MRGQPVDRDFFDTIMRRVTALERRAAQLENDNRPTVPFYDSANWPTNNAEGQIVIAPATALPCNFGDYSAKVDALDWANVDWLPDTVTYSEWYVTMQVWFPAATLAAWADHTANGNITSGSIIFAYIGGIDPGIFLANESDNTLHWCKTHDAASAGTIAYANRAPLTSAHIEPDICHTIGMHHTLTKVDYYIDGDIFTDVYTFTSAPWHPYVLYVGAVAQAGPSYVNDIYYIDNLKVGTTGWGSTDIYSEDFESGTISSDWDNNGLTAVAAPF